MIPVCGKVRYLPPALQRRGACLRRFAVRFPLPRLPTVSHFPPFNLIQPSLFFVPFLTFFLVFLIHLLFALRLFQIILSLFFLRFANNSDAQSDSLKVGLALARSGYSRWKSETKYY